MKFHDSVEARLGFYGAVAGCVMPQMPRLSVVGSRWPDGGDAVLAALDAHVHRVVWSTVGYAILVGCEGAMT